MMYANALFNLNTEILNGLKSYQDAPIDNFSLQIYRSILQSEDSVFSSIWKHISSLCSISEVEKNEDGSHTMSLINKIINASIENLVFLYKQHIKGFILSNLDRYENYQTNHGIPSKSLQEIIAFLDLKDELINMQESLVKSCNDFNDEDGQFCGVSIWKLIFHCFRMGDISNLMFIVNNAK